MESLAQTWDDCHPSVLLITYLTKVRSKMEKARQIGHNIFSQTAAVTADSRIVISADKRPSAGGLILSLQHVALIVSLC
jgi:hypothetical protein